MKLNKPQIFMLHFAGGSLHSFDFIRKFIPNSFEIHSLELPGRGIRVREPFVYSHIDAIQDYLTQIKAKRSSAPYIIYGHSMGAVLGLLVAEKLEALGDFPEGLVLTGNSGLRLKGQETKEKRYLMDDVEFKKELTELGGVPDEVLNNQELFEFFSPILRADFQVAEEICDTENTSVKAPIQILNGSEEDFDETEDNWSDFTKNTCTHKILPGGHFFIYDHCQELVDCILNSFKKNVI